MSTSDAEVVAEIGYFGTERPDLPRDADILDLAAERRRRRPSQQSLALELDQ